MIKSIPILFVILLAAPEASGVFAQSSNQTLFEKAETAFQTGQALSNLEKFDSAQIFLAEAINIWQHISPDGSSQEALVWAALAEN